MTVPAGLARQQYAGSGTTGPFAFNHKVYVAAHLDVTRTIAGVDTALVLTTDYTVALASDFSSASITLVTALAVGQSLTVVLDPPIEQQIAYADNDPFPAATHERALDLAAMVSQALAEKIARSLLLPVSATQSDLTLPLPQALKFLRWNAAADALENMDFASPGALLVSPFMQTVLDDVSAAAARATLAAVGTADVIAVAQGGTGLTTLTAAASAYAQLGAGFGLEAAIASAATVDLGTAPSHNVVVSGTTTITSFGASASLNTPLYLVKFSGAILVTHNATSLVLPGLVNYLTAAGDTMLVELVSGNNWRVRAIWPRNFTAPTVQSFLSGSGTYTPTSVNVRYIQCLMSGASGGGGAQITNAGTTGGNSSFASWTAIGGGGGAVAGGAGGAGGTGGVNGTGTLIRRSPGQNGHTGDDTNTDDGYAGGVGAFGGGGASVRSAAGSAAKANSGGGGGGARKSAGGGAGEYVEFYAAAVAASYAIGAGGAGGVAGTLAGGAGSAGALHIKEFYA